MGVVVGVLDSGSEVVMEISCGLTGWRLFEIIGGMYFGVVVVVGVVVVGVVVVVVVVVAAVVAAATDGRCPLPGTPTGPTGPGPKGPTPKGPPTPTDPPDLFGGIKTPDGGGCESGGGGTAGR